MYSCKVGTDFKVNFLKRSLNFCYDQDEGVIYANDLETLDKLGIERSKIEEAYDKKEEPKEELKEPLENLTKNDVKEICNELIQETFEAIVEQLTQLEKSQKEEIAKLRNEKVLLERTINELVEFHKELLQVDQENEDKITETTSTLKNSIGLLNKKIKESNESIENLSVRFDAILEMISEHTAKTGQYPNIMKNNMSLEKIWNSVTDKNSAAIFSIMFMVKKALEDKGLRLTA